MPRKPTAPKTVKAPAKRGAGYPALVKAILQVNTQMVTRVATVANQALVLRNWIVGAYIVEFEQEGADRFCVWVYAAPEDEGLIFHTACCIKSQSPFHR